MRSSIIVLLVLCVLSFQAESPVSGQTPVRPAAQIEAVKKLDLWVGEWKGTDWTSAGRDERYDFTIVEKVQRKVGGSVLLIEGRGTKKSDTGEAVVVHEALAVVSYDDKAKHYRWRAHDLRGQAIDVEPKVVDRGIEWGFKSEDRGVSIRFTIEFDEKRWHEVGEASTDGKAWHKFLEMTLERQK
jgi:hypothetical protein